MKRNKTPPGPPLQPHRDSQTDTLDGLLTQFFERIAAPAKVRANVYECIRRILCESVMATEGGNPPTREELRERLQAALQSAAPSADSPSPCAIIRSPEENIDRLLVYLSEQGHEDEILAWGQKLEWRKNPSLQGTYAAKPISVKKAWAGFRRALLHKTKDSDSAQNLLHKLLPERPCEQWHEPPEDPDLLPTQLHAWLEKWQAADGWKLTTAQKVIVERLTRLRDNLQSVAAEKTIRKAIRLGLQHHPFCLLWIMQRRAVGDRTALHALHRTHPYLEQGSSRERPISGEEKVRLKRICELRDKGLSLRSIHAYLQRQGAYAHAWAAFQKWCADPLRAAIIEPHSD